MRQLLDKLNSRVPAFISLVSLYDLFQCPKHIKRYVQQTVIHAQIAISMINAEIVAFIILISVLFAADCQQSPADVLLVLPSSLLSLFPSDYLSLLSQNDKQPGSAQ